MQKFSTKVKIIGVNPYVYLPKAILNSLFAQAKKNKGPIPVKGKLNGQAFTQTLVKYAGAWRFYLNGYMRQAAGIDVGDTAHVEITFDPKPRIEPMNPKLAQALSGNLRAKSAFDNLTPSRQKEILRYLNAMKTGASQDRNVAKVIRYLLGKKPPGLSSVLR